MVNEVISGLMSNILNRLIFLFSVPRPALFGAPAINSIFVTAESVMKSNPIKLSRMYLAD